MSLSAFGAMWTYYGPTGYQRAVDLENQVQDAQSRVANLKAEIARLKTVQDRLLNDDAYIEAAAREELGMIKRGEVLVDIGDLP